MEVVRQERVRAHAPNTAKIRCDLGDRILRDFPVSVCFFYERTLDADHLAHGLGAVLGPYGIFDARVVQAGSDLFIECGGTGVSFSVARSRQTMQQALASLDRPESEQLCDVIRPRRALARGEPVLRVRLTHFADGTSCLGMCWHHSVGDMHSFMQLMLAWSRAVGGASPDVPLIVEDRGAYLDRVLADTSRAVPGFRYLGARDLARFAFYLLTKARDRELVLFYFSQLELQDLRSAIGNAAETRVSVNDALCAHILSQVAEHDLVRRSRNLCVAVNFRKRAGLPEELLGNMITGLNCWCEADAPAAGIAKALRSGIDSFNEEHMDYRANVRLVNAAGRKTPLWRFMGRGVDPINGALLVTNWSRFGVYDVTFAGAAPFYFQPLGTAAPFPWVSSIYEGFENRGSMFALMLPRMLAARLTSPAAIRAVHQYRRSDDDIPDVARSLRWVR